MNNDPSKKERIIQKKSAYRRWQKVVSWLCAITVFTTTYALILPAITLETSPDPVTAEAEESIRPTLEKILEEMEIRPGEDNPGNGKTEQEVPAGFTEGCEIRTRRPGDRIYPFGMKGEKSLQDYLTDRRIDRAWRDRIPLLCRGQEVLLAAGVGAGRIPRWEKASRRERLVWKGSMPWMTERSMA